MVPKNDDDRKVWPHVYKHGIELVDFFDTCDSFSTPTPWTPYALPSFRTPLKIVSALSIHLVVINVLVYIVKVVTYFGILYVVGRKEDV